MTGRPAIVIETPDTGEGYRFLTLPGYGIDSIQAGIQCARLEHEGCAHGDGWIGVAVPLRQQRITSLRVGLAKVVLFDLPPTGDQERNSIEQGLRRILDDLDQIVATIPPSSLNRLVISTPALERWYEALPLTPTSQQSPIQEGDKRERPRTWHMALILTSCAVVGVAIGWMSWRFWPHRPPYGTAPRFATAPASGSGKETDKSVPNVIATKGMRKSTGGQPKGIHDKGQDAAFAGSVSPATVQTPTAEGSGHASGTKAEGLSEAPSLEKPKLGGVGGQTVRPETSSGAVAESDKVNAQNKNDRLEDGFSRLVGIWSEAYNAFSRGDRAGPSGSRGDEGRLSKLIEESKRYLDLDSRERSFADRDPTADLRGYRSRKQRVEKLLEFLEDNQGVKSHLTIFLNDETDNRSINVVGVALIVAGQGKGELTRETVQGLRVSSPSGGILIGYDFGISIMSINCYDSDAISFEVKVRNNKNNDTNIVTLSAYEHVKGFHRWKSSRATNGVNVSHISKGMTFRVDISDGIALPAPPEIGKRR